MERDSGQFILGIIIGGLVVFGLMALLVDYERDALMKNFAKGEIACEHYRSELICWNPKEEER